MIKFLSYLSVVLSLAVYILFTSYNNAKSKITALETKINAYKGNVCYLEKSIEERNKKILETAEQAKRFEQLAKEEKAKGGFDWSAPLPNDSIMHELRN